MTNPLTKREYFAAMALQGLLANKELRMFLSQQPSAVKIYAEAAVEAADALITVLNQNGAK